MDDNITNTPQPKTPQYVSKDTNNDVLSNFDISSTPVVTSSTSNNNQGSDNPNNSQTNSSNQFGYTSPYVGNQSSTGNINLSDFSNPSSNNNVATQSQNNAFVTNQPGSARPQAPMQPAQPPVYPVEPAVKPEPRKVIYEKTIVEKGPSFLSTIFSQLFKLLGCFLFAVFVIIAIVVYVINF